VFIEAVLVIALVGIYVILQLVAVSLVIISIEGDFVLTVRVGMFVKLIAGPVWSYKTVIFLELEVPDGKVEVIVMVLFPS
jgi:hypothetical protein